MDSWNKLEKSQQDSSKYPINDSSDSSDSILDGDQTNNFDCKPDEFNIPKQKLYSSQSDMYAAKPLTESPESPHSLRTDDCELPFVETAGIKLYKCPHYKEGCKIRNIHPEEIILHFKFKHLQDELPIVNTSAPLSNIVYEQRVLLSSVIPRTLR
jgi:hypothetical protein